MMTKQTSSNQFPTRAALLVVRGLSLLLMIPLVIVFAHGSLHGHRTCYAPTYLMGHVTCEWRPTDWALLPLVILTVIAASCGSTRKD